MVQFVPSLGATMRTLTLSIVTGLALVACNQPPEGLQITL
ncbi:MAG: hypothetical protein ACI9MC_000842, partial [Kiritimatiellia bacterium]